MFPDLDDPHTLPAATPQQREAVRLRGTRLRRRRRALQSAVPAGVALAAVALFAALNSPFADSAPDPAQPVGPSPKASEATGWPDTVDVTSLDAQEPLAKAPLPGGADLAVVKRIQADAREDNLYVVSGVAVRLAASARAIYDPALSPDGRLLAYSTSDWSEPDRLAVVDVTTGRVLLDEVIRTTFFDPGQTRELDWSADGSVLVHALAITTGRPVITDQIRAYRIDRGQVEVVAEWDTIPGDYIGVSPDGTRVAAVSGDQVAWSDIGSTTWQPSGLAVPPPAVPPLGRPINQGPLGQHRWSPDGRSLAWVVASDPALGTASLVAMDLATGDWSQRPLPREAEFLGWHGGQALVSSSSVSSSGLAAEVSLVDPAGSTRVISSASSVRVGMDGWFGSVALNRLP